MPALLVLSYFSADIDWLGRRTLIRDLRAGIPWELVENGGLVLCDMEALAPLLLKSEVRNLLRKCLVLLMDSLGPAHLPPEFVRLVRSSSNILLGYSVGSQRKGYLKLGLPRDRLVRLRASSAFFPIMYPRYTTPDFRWTPPNHPRILCGGRAWRDWNTLKAAARLLEREIEVITDTSRVRIGDASGMRIRGCVPFWDFCRELARSSCLVLPLIPDRNAGQATLVLAMHLGVPVVATSTAAIRDCVRNGREGLLVPPGRPGELARAVLKLLGDSRMARKLAKNARIAERELCRKTEAAMRKVFRLAGV